MMISDKEFSAADMKAFAYACLMDGRCSPLAVDKMFQEWEASREPKKEKPLPLTDEEIIKIREFLASHALFIQKH